MGVTEKIQSAIQRLQETKNTLLLKTTFLDSNNSSKVYSNETLVDKNSTQGSTPSDIKKIIEVVMSETKVYVDSLKKYPFIEGDSFGSSSKKIEAKRHSLTPNNSILTNISSAGIFRYIGDATIDTGVLRVDITQNPSFVDDTLHSIKLYRVNARLGISEEHLVAGSGEIVSFDGADINIDDIFFSTISHKLDSDGKTILVDGVFTIEVKLSDSTDIVNIPYNSSGQPYAFSDSDLRAGNSFAWAIFSMSDIKSKVIANTTDVEIEPGILVSSRITSGSSIVRVMTDNNYVNISSLMLVAGLKTGTSIVYDGLMFDVFASRSSSSKAIMSNIIPIGDILKEKINEL